MNIPFVHKFKTKQVKQIGEKSYVVTLNITKDDIINLILSAVIEKIVVIENVMEKDENLLGELRKTRSLITSDDEKMLLEKQISHNIGRLQALEFAKTLLFVKGSE